MSTNHLEFLSVAGANPGSGSGAAAGPQAGGRQFGGKVVNDSRGNAIWDWAVATGVLAGIHSAELLRMLDDPTLTIDGDSGIAAEWAGDPYNRR
jgi:hypothetical protein